MQHTVTYDEAADLIRVLASGRPELSGFLAVVDACAEVFDARHCRRILADYRGLDGDFDHFTVAMLGEIADHTAAAAVPRSPFTSAIICRDGNQFALTRVYDVLVTRPDIEVQQRVFLDAAEARRWLDETRPPRPQSGRKVGR